MKLGRFIIGMLFMKDWACKKKHEFVRTICSKWKEIISLVFALIGGLFTFSEILNNIFECNLGYYFIRIYPIQILIFFVFICIVLEWQKLKFTCFLDDTDIKITLLVDDMFRQKGAFVIPTNTTFDTLMDGEFISAESVQGQYQKKYYLNNLSKLDLELEHQLATHLFICLDDSRTTKLKRYEIGTTCKISNSEKRNIRHAYFLAVADINRFGKPENVTPEKLVSALVFFWQQLSMFGHLETILMPIIGTGKAGVRNTSRDQIIKEIIFTFVVSARETKVTEDLIICISPRDFAQKNLHWDNLCEYLQFICKHQYKQLTDVEGSAETEGNSLLAN